MLGVKQFPPPLCFRIESILSQHAIVYDDDTQNLAGAQVFFNKVEHVPQNGPQCGLVALSMASKMLGLRTISVDDIFNIGKSVNVTKKGELFSANWLGQLGEKIWPEIKWSTHIFPSPETITKRIMEGQALLVPYDCDKNFEPCLNRGHTAHWALIAGFVYVTVDSFNVELCKNPPIDIDASKLYVFAFHGKSRHMSIWSYNHLLKSNQQLFEVGPLRDSEDYMIPSASLDDLRNKVVWIRQ